MLCSPRGPQSKPVLGSKSVKGSRRVVQSRGGVVVMICKFFSTEQEFLKVESKGQTYLIIILQLRSLRLRPLRRCRAQTQRSFVWITLLHRVWSHHTPFFKYLESKSLLANQQRAGSFLNRFSKFRKIKYAWL